MTDKEYKQKKRECLLDFCRECDYKITPSVERTFGYAFDRAYALGKQETKSFQNGNTSNHSGNHFPDVRNMVNTRLHIAANILGDIIKTQYYSLSPYYQEEHISEMAKVSVQIADALIAECEKGDSL